MLYGGMTMSTLYLGGVVGELHLMSDRLQSNSQHFRCLDQLLRLSERECHLSAFSFDPKADIWVDIPRGPPSSAVRS
jgi:hypothetical protein